MNSCVHGDESRLPKHKPRYKDDHSMAYHVTIQGAESRKELTWIQIQRAPMVSKKSTLFWKIKENKTPKKTIFTVATLSEGVLEQEMNHLA